MKIVIASSGRAHLLDCARELYNQGHDVKFYACTPKKYLRQYGFPHGNSILWFMFPFFVFRRYFPSEFSRQLFMEALDFIVYFLMPKCDVFIAQSPNYSRCMLKAKKKYNAICILDRGSSHIRTFNNIGKLCGQTHVNKRYVNIDEKEYSYADYIAIASSYVERSFIENGYDRNKLFINPYGVSLKNFHPTYCTNEFDCIYVGNWGKRKGCQLIIEAFKDTELKILHVGAIHDLKFPNYHNFVHVNPVSENLLINYYSKAKIFIFPSYDDGFGLVLCQAAACGLPIVCSPNTGGLTLKEIIDDKDNIYIMNDLTANSLYNGVIRQLESIKENKVRNYAKEKMKEFSWESYGKRYNHFLNNIKTIPN